MSKYKNLAGQLPETVLLNLLPNDALRSLPPLSSLARLSSRLRFHSLPLFPPYCCPSAPHYPHIFLHSLSLILYLCSPLHLSSCTRLHLSRLLSTHLLPLRAPLPRCTSLPPYAPQLSLSSNSLHPLPPSASFLRSLNPLPPCASSIRPLPSAPSMHARCRHPMMFNYT